MRINANKEKKKQILVFIYHLFSRLMSKFEIQQSIFYIMHSVQNNYNNQIHEYELYLHKCGTERI